MQSHALLYLNLLVPAALRGCEINIVWLEELFIQNTRFVKGKHRFATLNGAC